MKFAKTILILFFLFLITNKSFSQEEVFKEIKFEEFIAQAKDTGRYLILKNTIIVVSNREYSSLINRYDNTEINKEIYLENVMFSLPMRLENFVFNETVIFKNSLVPPIIGSTFHKGLIIENDIDAHPPNTFQNYLRYSLDRENFLASGYFFVSNCNFYDLFQINISDPQVTHFCFADNILFKNTSQENSKWFLHSSQKLGVRISNLKSFDFYNNQICSPFSTLDLSFLNNERTRVARNNFFTKYSVIDFENELLQKDAFTDYRSSQMIILEENEIESLVFVNPIQFHFEDYISWADLADKVIFTSSSPLQFLNAMNLPDSDLIVNYESRYLDSIAQDQKSYNFAVSNYGNFIDYYKLQHNQDWANLVFSSMKDLQTKRYKYLYSQNKNFNSYFKWKVNQFVKVFSEYGTEPGRAIVIAIYVIFTFAFFYLLFPNSWDEKNKHRMMNRVLFFTKYFKVKEGMKEVYEEDNKPKMLAYEEFKNYMNDSKKEVPSYFITLAKPIYGLSVVNYRIRSKILSKADILQGKWKELSPKRKVITSIIMAFWLISILTYDITVKFFNALMLSINTFSTLGFGEIPIKGVPRYLAILQGFLGWFMLSIFSVSLISQLLG